MNAPDLTPAPVSGAAPLAAVVPLSDLYPSPSNPRKHFEGLGELALSLARKGVEIPLIVRTRETAQGRLEIVDGERRYKAALQAGLQFVPVIQRDTMTDADVLELQLENAMQRSDLTPLEEARGIKALLKSSTATPAEIARRMSRSERFIADRLRLLDLIPALQQLLDQGRITVAHADLLSKLAKEDQARAVDPGRGGRHDFRRAVGGLWQEVGATLEFDLDDEAKHEGKDPYAGLKPVTAKELEAWIARHVRFDVDRMAETAPLEFARVQGQVAAAALAPGRGKKVIHITEDSHLADDVRDPSQRVYGPRSWKRADGTVASVLDDRGKRVDAKTCPYSILGLVTVGPGYGTAFQVCIARDTCTVHWGKEIKAKAKTQKLIETGQGAKVAAQAKTQREKEAAADKRREEERKAVNALYRRVYPMLAKAVLAAVPAADTAAALAYLWRQCTHSDKPPKDVTTPDLLLRALVVRDVEHWQPSVRPDNWENSHHRLNTMQQLAEAFGVNAKAIIAGEKASLAAEAKAAAKVGAPAAPKPARKRR